MFNDVFLAQSLILLVSFLFITISNTFLLWYCVVVLLFLIGSVLFLDNFDIFVGFLLLIDLGVVLIFLVLVFHFINFLDNKNSSKKSIKKFFFIAPVSSLILNNSFLKPLEIQNGCFTFLVS
jgi:hypothetical protein